jgi:ethanolamine utilization protein EutP
VRTGDKSLRVMAIGPVGAGKSTLLARLGLRSGPARKTGGVEFHAEAVDTPGEAFEIPTLYHMLIMSSTKASIVLLLADPTQKRRFPARFALSMRAPIVGVVSKIDIATPENILRAEKALVQSGVRKIFRVSSITGEGLPDLESYLIRDRY